MVGKVGNSATRNKSMHKLLALLLAMLMLVSLGLSFQVFAADEAVAVDLGAGWSDNGDGTYSYSGEGDGVLNFPGIETDAADWKIYEFKATVTVESDFPAGWTAFGPMLVNKGDPLIYFRTQWQGGTYVMYSTDGITTGEYDIGLDQLSTPAYSVGSVLNLHVIVEKASRRVQYYVNDEKVHDFVVRDVDGVIAAGEELPALAAIKARCCGKIKVSDVSWAQCQSFPGEGGSGSSTPSDADLGAGWTDNGDDTYSYDGSGGGNLAFYEIETELSDYDIYEFVATIKVESEFPAGWTGFGPMMFNDGDKQLYFRTQYGGGTYLMYTTKGNAAEDPTPGTGMCGSDAFAVGSENTIKIIVQRSKRRVQYTYNDTIVFDGKVPNIDDILAEGDVLPLVAAIKPRSSGKMLVSNVSWQGYKAFPGEDGEWICGPGWTVDADGTIRHNGRGGIIYYNRLTDEEKAWPIYEVTADVTVESAGAASWVGWGPLVIRNDNGTCHFRTQYAGGMYLMSTPVGSSEQDSGAGMQSAPVQAVGETYSIKWIVDRAGHKVTYYINDVLCADITLDTFGGLIDEYDDMEMVIGFGTSSAPELTIKNLKWVEGDASATMGPGEYLNPLEEECLVLEAWFPQLGERVEEPKPVEPDTGDDENSDVTDVPSTPVVSTPSVDSSDVSEPESSVLEESVESSEEVTEYEEVIEQVIRRRKKKKGLSAGAIAGIVGGSVAGALVIAALVAMLISKKKTGHWFLLFAKKKKKKEEEG